MLHLAVLGSNFMSVELILKSYESNIQEQDDRRIMALDYALKSESIEIAQVILQHAAHFDIDDFDK